MARQGLLTVLLAKSTSTHCLLHLLHVLPSKGRRNGVASGPHPQGPQGPQGLQGPQGPETHRQQVCGALFQTCSVQRSCHKLLVAPIDDSKDKPPGPLMLARRVGTVIG